MGWKYEVDLWTEFNGEYDYVSVYRGNSRLKAKWAIHKARKHKRAVQVTIRG